jgi:hypothetical protein
MIVAGYAKISPISPVRELGYSMLEIARRLGISQPGVVYAVRRGERIAKERDVKLTH